MALAQFALEQLAARVLGDRIGEHHRLGTLETGHLAAAMRQNIVLYQRLAVLDDNHGDDGFHPVRMRHADHSDFRDRAHPVDHLFDLAAGDVLAPGLDHVLLAVDHRDVALVVDRSQVPGVEPAALEGRFGALVVVKVPEHQMGRAVHDFSNLARIDVLHRIVHDPGLDVQRCPAAGTGFAQLVLRPEHGGQRRDLGLAIQVPQLDVGEPRGQFPQHLDRHDGRAVVALAQFRQVGCRQQRRAQQRDPDRGRREERRDAMPRDQRQQVVGRGSGGDHVTGTDVDRRSEKHIELRAVVERQCMQQQVIRSNAGIDHTAHVLPDHRVVGQHGAFGHRLGAAGVHDLRQVGPGKVHRRRWAGPSGQFIETHHAGCRHARLFRGQPDEVAHGGVERSGCARELGQPRVGGQHLRLGMAQDVGDLVRLEHEVDRYQHGAEPRQCEAHRREGVRVARQHCDARPLDDSATCQPGGNAVADGVELRIGPAGGAADDRGLVREAPGAAVQQVGQGLAAKRGVHGCLLRMGKGHRTQAGARCRVAQPMAAAAKEFDGKFNTASSVRTATGRALTLY